jgi:GT2 family glycosyltransferase
MLNLPDVDVVILSLNRAELTVACVESVLEQENITPHLFIIDQGSEESQLSFLKKFTENISSILLIELNNNLGVPGGRNLGMKKGKSDYIVCIDNDAEFESPYEVGRAIAELQKDSSEAVLGFKIVNYFSNELDITSWSYPKTMLPRQNEVFKTTRFCGAGHAIRRSALELTEYYDESLFFYWEEVDLSYQLINLGFEILYYPPVVIRHKVSLESKVSWDGDRFYFLVRNFLYLHWKFYQSIWSFLIYAGGYFIKAGRNRLLNQYYRGISDSIRMVRQNKKPNHYKLNKAGRLYIHTFDTDVRGDFITRIKNEVFSRLPGEK